ARPPVSSPVARPGPCPAPSTPRTGPAPRPTNGAPRAPTAPCRRLLRPLGTADVCRGAFPVCQGIGSGAGVLLHESARVVGGRTGRLGAGHRELGQFRVLGQPGLLGMSRTAVPQALVLLMGMGGAW